MKFLTKALLPQSILPHAHFGFSFVLVQSSHSSKSNATKRMLKLRAKFLKSVKHRKEKNIHEEGTEVKWLMIKHLNKKLSPHSFDLVTNPAVKMGDLEQVCNG